MRYIDITTNTLTQNLLAVDLRFKTINDNLVLLSNNLDGRFANADTLNEALTIIDGDIGGNGTSTAVILIDEDGNETHASKIIFDDVTVTGENTAKVLLDNSLDRTIKNINDSTVIYEGAPAKTHIFIHNLNSEFFKFNIWIEEQVGWQNSIVPITIIDNNTVKVELVEEKSIRIILENINEISKTYGL